MSTSLTPILSHGLPHGQQQCASRLTLIWIDSVKLISSTIKTLQFLILSVLSGINNKQFNVFSVFAVHHSDRMRGPPPNLPHAPRPPGPPPILNGPPPPPHTGTGPGLYDGQLQIYPALGPSMPGGPAGTNVVTFADRNHAGHALEESSIVNMRGHGRDYRGARGGRGKGSQGWGRGGFNNNNINHSYMDQQDVRNETSTGAPSRDVSKTVRLPNIEPEIHFKKNILVKQVLGLQTWMFVKQ